MSKQILLVEDDAAIMDTLAIFLHYEGYSVLKARSVEKALEKLESEHLDLILLDYMLQDDTAEPVVDAVRQRHPDVPILLLTAADDPSGKARTVGADGVVSKPFELDVLLKHIRDFMHSKSRRTDADAPKLRKTTDSAPSHRL